MGYSFGSAICGLVLTAGTDTVRVFPDPAAYTTAAWIGIAAMTITVITSLALAANARRRRVGR